MDIVTKCEYYETRTGWAYRAWMNNSTDYAVWQYWTEGTIAYSLSAPTAFYKLVEHITRRGLALGCMPAMVD